MKLRLARAAYAGFRAARPGQPNIPFIPEWDDLSDVGKDAWIASITAIQDALCEEVKRELADAAFMFCERLLKR